MVEAESARPATRLLLVNQHYHPDVASTGQHLTDLAEYLAYRLTQQELNWWGAATNLQDRTGNPWRVARDIALERIDFSRLNPTDRELLSFAPAGSSSRAAMPRD